MEQRTKFYWHYMKKSGSEVVVVWEGSKYFVNDIVFHIDLRKNPMKTMWHRGQPRLTCNGHADRMEIIREKTGKTTAYIY